VKGEGAIAPLVPVQFNFLTASSLTC